MGAGCFGAWTALRLRESGRSVALIDALGPGHSRSSSGGATRIIRMGYGSCEIYTRWALESLAEWKRLFERAGSPELFQHTGVLWTALKGHAHAEDTRTTFERLGVRYQTLTSDQVRKQYPLLRFDDEMTGVLECDSGALLASRAVQAAAAEAVRMGAGMLTARVLPPRQEGRLDWIATEDQRKIAGDVFLFACGPWLPKLFPRLLRDRIRVTRQEVFYFSFDPAAMPIWIDFSDPRGVYTLPPLAGKGFKLALDRHGPEFDPDTEVRNVSAEQVAEARAFLRERFPAVANAPLLETEVCQYENTCNGDFLIDRHPEYENVWLAGGGSGHGFKHGPAVGAYVASLVDGSLDAEPRFSFESKTAVRERTVF